MGKISPCDEMRTEYLIPQFVIVPVNTIFFILFSGSALPPGKGIAAKTDPVDKISSLCSPESLLGASNCILNSFSWP